MTACISREILNILLHTFKISPNLHKFSTLMVPLCFYLFREKSLCGNKEVNIWYLPSLLSAISFSFFCYLFSNVLTPQKTWDFVPAFSPLLPELSDIHSFNSTGSNNLSWFVSKTTAAPFSRLAPIVCFFVSLSILWYLDHSLSTVVWSALKILSVFSMLELTLTQKTKPLEVLDKTIS